MAAVTALEDQRVIPPDADPAAVAPTLDHKWCSKSSGASIMASASQVSGSLPCR